MAKVYIPLTHTQNGHGKSNLHKVMFRSPTNNRRLSSDAIVYLVIGFLAVSTFFSIFGSNKYKPPRLKERPPPPAYHPHGPVLYAETSAAPLSYAERNDLTWSDQKCRAEFPLFYPQLEELGKYWTDRGGLNKSVIDGLERDVTGLWGFSRIIIRNNKVYIRSFEEGRETRNSALLRLLTRAISTWPTSSTLHNSSTLDQLPPIDMIMNPGDKDQFSRGGGWAVAKLIDDESTAGTWLMPDFGFIAWPEAGAGLYEDFIELAADVEKEYVWKKKYDKVFWRGWAGNYPNRRDMIRRTSLKEDSNRLSWSNVHETTFHDDVGDFYPIVTLPNHCQHKYLIHTEGNSYSGRSKYLFSCKSITIAHPMEWTQHFHAALNANTSSIHQNYVQLPGPLFDRVEEAAKALQKADTAWTHVEEAKEFIGKQSPEKIAENVIRIMRDRYLTPAATMCYLRAALREYAASLDIASWGSEGITILPGQGVLPGTSRNESMVKLKGDIEERVWSLLGGPDWPTRPQNDSGPVKIRHQAPVVVVDSSSVKV